MATRSSRNELATRRDWLVATAGSVMASSLSGWMPALAAAAEEGSRPQRSCVLLWMNGGPAQTDTFDLKTGHENSGPFNAIETKVSGIRVSEHLPGIAKWTDRLAIVRSMST